MSIADILAAKKAQAIIKLKPSPDAPLPKMVAEQALEAIIANPKASFVEKVQARKKLAVLKAEHKALSTPPPEPTPVVEAPRPTETFSLDIVLNERQQAAADLAQNGKSFVLTGAAGTGKTTAVREIAKRLLEHGALGTHNFKIDFGGENIRVVAPSIAFCAFTRRATNNIRRALHMDPHLEEQLEHNVVTIHRLLEYQPVSFITEEGNESIRFEPQRTRTNPLTLTHLILEESSMLDVNLYANLLDALLPDCQIIFLGDINQLQPVMGKSILQYGLVKLPVIELKDVYRQALDSDIIVCAHAVLNGNVNKFFDTVDTSPKKQVRIVGRNQAYTEEKLVQGLAQSFEKLHANGQYDPEQDIILSPFNKNALGTDNINNWIAQFLGSKRQAVVHEVIAGRRKLYLAKGDRVMVDKRDGVISDIKNNGQYIGTAFQPPSVDLTRFGIRVLGNSAQNDSVDEADLFIGYENLDIDDDTEVEEKKREASHSIHIQYEDGGQDIIHQVGALAQARFSLGYALTVHKAQGCEWRKVYLVLHKNHAVMLNRELFYTACTRAREKLEVIANEHVIKRCITNARIKGNSLEEKIEYFNSGSLDASTVQVLPNGEC